MYVGVLYVEMHLPGATSLKDKRQIVQSVKMKLRSKFNVSASEVDFQDLWQRAGMGVAAVSGDRANLEHTLHHILEIIESRDGLEVARHTLEIF